MLCAFFKQGQCSKGDRCKFSHDLALERKAEKRSVYCDMRDEGDDTMENWDEEKLKEVVEKKHGEAERKMPPTDIVRLIVCLKDTVLVCNHTVIHLIWGTQRFITE